MAPMNANREALIAFNDPTEVAYWYVRHGDLLHRHTADVVWACRSLASEVKADALQSTDQVLVEWLQEQGALDRH